MKKRVTIQEVAAQAGVSITTVSRYLNERYEAMSEATRKRIADVIQQLGYRPNSLAQGLKGNRTRIVAAVVVNMSYPFCVGFIRALNEVLSEAGYHLFVCETGGSAKREREIIESLQAQRVDAMVLQSGGDNNDLLAEIAKFTPVVFVDRWFEIDHVTNVTTNNREASRSLTEHLLDSGYERVLYVTEQTEDVPTRRERLDGYLEACHKHHIAPWVQQVDRQDTNTFKAVLNALEGRRESRKALYTANGLLMMQLFPELSKRRDKIPDELGIATFDQPDWASLVQPSLTCVSQPIEEMGHFTGEFLVDQLKEISDEMRCVTKEISSTLIPGGSTRAVGR